MSLAVLAQRGSIRIRPTLARANRVALSGVLACLFWLGVAKAQIPANPPANPLTNASVTTATTSTPSASQRGQFWYRHGWDGQAACQRCHGRQGEGQAEGGIRAPALAGLFDLQALQRAVQGGVGRSGQTLHSLMPRYLAEPAILTDLQAYLAIIGNDIAGVEAHELRIGVALPPTIYGAAILAGLKQALDPVTVYGRRLELVPNGAPDQVLVQLVNSVRPQTGAPVQEQPPLLGPLPLPGTAGISGTSATAGAAAADGLSVFHVLPDVAEQARMLLMQARLAGGNQSVPEQLHLVADVSGDPVGLAWLAALRQQARQMHLALREYDGVATAAQVLQAGLPVIFLGSAAALRDCLGAAGSGPIFVSAATAAPLLPRLSEIQAARLRLILPWHTSSAAPDLVAAYREAAYSVGLILIEALKRTGRQIGPTQLMQQLERLRDFSTPAFGKISLGAGQHHASHGGQLLGVKSGQLVLLRLIAIP